MTTPDPAAQMAQLHEILLRVAGGGADNLVATARLRLGENLLAEAAQAAADTRVALPEADRALLAEITGRPVPAGTATPPAYDFLPATPIAGPLPPLLDLTVPHDWLTPLATDDADRAATEAVRALDGAVALWRAWRLGDDAIPVYLVEADRRAADLPDVAATVQEALTAAGLPLPQVEAYAPGADLPAYQRRARGGSALLWAAAPAEPIEVARVFDLVDPITGPAFAPDHPRLDDPAVLAYLAAGTPLLATTERMADVVDPDRGAVVPLSYRTDGRWIWTDTVEYYLREHALAPDPDLLGHIRAADGVPKVDAVRLHRALATLFVPADVEPVWTSA